MPLTITINTVNGVSPFDVYLCDDPITTCIYIDTITSVPYDFVVPTIIENLGVYNVKVVDDNGCEATTNLITP
jgi:hypothetical protein